MIGKFKVWDKERKTFIEHDNGTFFLSMNGELMAYLDCMALAGPDYIPVHSTSKTDKNGVELFDGDIVENEYQKFVVRWDEISSSFKLFSIINKFDHVINSFIDTLEKIGNKFENPELLETI